MNAEERNRIISNDYADFMVEIGIKSNNYNVFPNNILNLIDHQYAVAHIPVDNMTSNSIYKFGYTAIPSCYGLLSSIDSYPSSEISNSCLLPDFELRGQGVLVGFVDTGIDYRNDVFKYENNTSRIVSIWDQTINSENYPKGYNYGTEYSQEQINLALQNVDPLSVVSSEDDIGHGTMLAGISAGLHDVEGGYAGIAPDVNLVVVKLKTAKPYLKDFYSIPSESICYQENDIMFGVRYLVEVAKRLKRPIAICIGLGTSLGDHGGSNMLCHYLSVVGQAAGTAIVVAAGNEGNRGHHYYGEINPFIGYDDVKLNVADNDKGFTMELWGKAPTGFTIEIFAPSGEFVSRIPTKIGQKETLMLYYEDTSIIVDNQIKKPNVGVQLFIFRFKNPMAGIWKFRVVGHTNLPFTFHIWLPIENFMANGTFFINPNENTTITLPGNQKRLITVTTYNHLNQCLYYNSSNGFSLSNEIKPDFAAPGVDLNCPTINNEFVRGTGSSFAAAYTTGVTALFLEWGILKGYLTSINSLQIKWILNRAAKRDPNLIYPNQNWGYGILDTKKAFDLLNLYFEYYDADNNNMTPSS